MTSRRNESKRTVDSNFGMGFRILENIGHTPDCKSKLFNPACHGKKGWGIRGIMMFGCSTSWFHEPQTTRRINQHKHSMVCVVYEASLWQFIALWKSYLYHCQALGTASLPSLRLCKFKLNMLPKIAGGFNPIEKYSSIFFLHCDWRQLPQFHD